MEGLGKVILLAFTSLAYARHTPFHDYETPCAFNGQFVVNPHDECTYYRCDYASHDTSTSSRFVAILMRCPYGTASSLDKFDDYSPCGRKSDACGDHGAKYEYAPGNASQDQSPEVAHDAKNPAAVDGGPQHASQNPPFITVQPETVFQSNYAHVEGPHQPAQYNEQQNGPPPPPGSIHYGENSAPVVHHHPYHQPQPPVAHNTYQHPPPAPGSYEQLTPEQLQAYEQPRPTPETYRPPPDPNPKTYIEVPSPTNPYPLILPTSPQEQQHPGHIAPNAQHHVLVSYQAPHKLGTSYQNSNAPSQTYIYPAHSHSQQGYNLAGSSQVSYGPPQPTQPSYPAPIEAREAPKQKPNTYTYVAPQYGAPRPGPTYHQSNYGSPPQQYHHAVHGVSPIETNSHHTYREHSSFSMEKSPTGTKYRMSSYKSPDGEPAGNGNMREIEFQTANRGHNPNIGPILDDQAGFRLRGNFPKRMHFDSNDLVHPLDFDSTFDRLARILHV